MEITVGQSMVGGLEFGSVGDGLEVALRTGVGDEDEGLIFGPDVVIPRVGLMLYGNVVDVVVDKLILDTIEEDPGVAGAEDNGVVELEVDPISGPFVNGKLEVLVAVSAGVELELEDSNSPPASVLLYTVTIITSPSFSVGNCRLPFSSAIDIESEGCGTMAMPPHL